MNSISGNVPKEMVVNGTTTSFSDEVAGVSMKELRPGYAPIKKEYLLEARSAATIFLTETCRDESGNKVKCRGMNRERCRKMAKARADVRGRYARLCVSVVSNKTCKYGDKCTSLHSLSDYLAIKPPDLGRSCYIFEQRGQCPFSHACRFARSHTNDDSSQKVKQPSDRYCRTLNAESVALQKALRKKQYDFSKCQKALDDLPQLIGCMERQKLKLDLKSLSGKAYLAPLTTVGNLPFRRICVDLGADITCGEMCVCTSLLSGIASEWSLLKRHPSEKIFGVQLAGGFPDTMSRAAQVITENMDIDFIDINCGCPLDVINEKGGGCALASRSNKLDEVMKTMSMVINDVPLTLKLRTGLKEGVYTAHQTIAKIVASCPPQLITIHPRSKEQRYTKLADWEYTHECSRAAGEVPLWACGDVLSYHDYHKRLEEYPVKGVMIARGALIKPWIFTEIKERRDWDISARERLDFYQRFVNYGLDHWGSDDAGVEKTRSFLLEWLSFAYRYIPLGLLEVIPQRINERPPTFRGRTDLETLMSSSRCKDWVKLSEMFLGKVPDGFLFIPKHNANAYSVECVDA